MMDRKRHIFELDPIWQQDLVLVAPKSQGWVQALCPSLVVAALVAISVRRGWLVIHDTFNCQSCTTSFVHLAAIKLSH